MNNRDEKGHFLQGWSGNPRGRPKSGEMEELRKALGRAKKEKGISLIDHCVQRAYEDNSMAAVILRKILPDLKHVDNELPGDIKITVIDSYKIDKA